MKLNGGCVFLTLLLVLGMGGVLVTQAADHADFPSDDHGRRQDANITDFHAFKNGDNLVFAVSLNPTIPPGTTSYTNPDDLIVRINIDNQSVVNGTIVDPGNIGIDVSFIFTFDNGSPRVRRFDGGVESPPAMSSLFIGLRDDPFIRAPREGRNIEAIVIEVPSSSVLNGQSEFLAWATSEVEGFDDDRDSAGLPLNSMFNLGLNTVPPWNQPNPDVLIVDTKKPTKFPNGRALKDDVVDLMCKLFGVCQLFNEEGASGPKQNDVPFLDSFPYLAGPHV